MTSGRIVEHVYRCVVILAGQTPLSCAVLSEKLTCLKLLLKMGADINTQGDQGRTRLSRAAYQVTSHLGIISLRALGGDAGA